MSHDPISAALPAYRSRWAGTPFREYSRAPGPMGGVDCVNLALDWLLTLGIIREAPELPFYHADYGLHNADDLIDATIREQGLDSRLQRICYGVVNDLQPGDIVAFNTGSGVGHLGVVVGPAAMILHCLRGAGVKIHQLNDLVYFSRRVCLRPSHLYRPTC